MKMNRGMILSIGLVLLLSCSDSIGKKTEEIARANKALGSSYTAEQKINENNLYSWKFDSLLCKNKFEEALKESEKMLEKDPSMEDLCFIIGVLNEKLGNLSEAQILFKKSIDIYNTRLENSKKPIDYFGNKLNLAVSKLLYGDNSYLEDLNELKQYEDYWKNIVYYNFETITKEELINELLDRDSSAVYYYRDKYFDR